MYTQLVETTLIDYLPTFQLSQDSLESLFSRIRSLNGNCDNPPVTMFSSALRKILIHNEITSSGSANCADNLKILSFPSQYKKTQNLARFHVEIDHHESEENIEFLQAIILNENDFLMDLTEETSIALIASSVEKKIQTSGRFECECVYVLRRNEKVYDITTSNDYNPPCISTLYICKVAHILFYLCRNQINFDYVLLVDKILLTIDYENIFIDYFVCDLDHKLGLVKYIVEEYIRLQATYIAKNLTLIEQKILCRKFLQKRIHFCGQ